MRARTAVKRLATFLVLALALAIPAAMVPRDSAQAVGSETSVTAGGNGIYPDAADFSGVTLSGGKFGTGALVNADGSAEGVVEAMLSGITLIGMDVKIVVTGVASTGTVNGATATISGAASVDMGDGTPPSTGVPFTAVLGPAGLQLTVGASVLPNLAKTDGFIVIE